MKDGRRGRLVLGIPVLLGLIGIVAELVLGIDPKEAQLCFLGLCGGLGIDAAIVAQACMSRSRG